MLKQFFIVVLALISPKLDCTTLTVTNPSGDVVTLDGDYFLGGNTAIFSPYHEIIIDNTSGGAATATLDGNGHTVYFPYNTATPTFSFITNPVDLTLTDVKLQGYDPDAVTFLSTSKFIFGDLTRIVLEKDIEIGASDLAWTGSGNVEIFGLDHSLTVNGSSGLVEHGLDQSMTLKNVNLKVARTDSVGIVGEAAKIVFEDSRLELYRDGMAIEQGSVDIQGTVCIRGVDKSLFSAPNQAELETRFEGLGFGLFDGHTEPTTFSLGVSDDSTFTAVRINKEDKAFYTEDTDPYAVTWTEILGTDYLSIDVGTDGQIWVIKTDNTVHRVTKGGPPTLTAATGQNGDYITVGSADHVFILNSSGEVYKNDDPTGTPTSWTQVTGVVSPTSIAAGSDGTLWFIDPDGRIQKKDGDNIEVVSEGIGRAFQKVSAAGTKTSNYVAALSSEANGGRVVISKDNGPFKDLGIFKVTDIGIGEKGSMMSTFDSSLIVEDPTFGRPIYSSIQSDFDPILMMDRTLTFSSAGTMTVKSGSELKFEDGSEFRYEPDITNNPAIQDKRRHFSLEDGSATLSFNCASLNTGKFGLSLEQGRLVFKGFNYLYSSQLLDKQFELGTDVETIVKNGATLNVMGAVDYVPTDEMDFEIVPYYEVFGPDETTMKTGVTDPTTLQGITDAYAAGFKAPGLVASDWQYNYAAIVDTTADFADNPTIWGSDNSTGPYRARVDLGISKASFSRSGATLNMNVKLSLSGVIFYHLLGVGNNCRSFGPVWVDPGDPRITGSSQMYAFAPGKVSGNLITIYFGRLSDNTMWTRVDDVGLTGIIVNNEIQVTGVSVKSGNYTIFTESRRPNSLGADFNDNVYFIENGTDILKKRDSGATVTTVTLPGALSGTVVSVAVAGNSTQSYTAILSSTGQVFIRKNEEAWQDLNLSGVVGIDIGVRGSVLILLKRDVGVHSSGNPILIKPGF